MEQLNTTLEAIAMMRAELKDARMTCRPELVGLIDDACGQLAKAAANIEDAARHDAALALMEVSCDVE